MIGMKERVMASAVREPAADELPPHNIQQGINSAAHHTSNR